MAVVFQVINVGTVANDGTGDPLRTAFIKVNDNFSLTAPLDGANLTNATATQPPLHDSDNSIATTGWVQNELASYAPIASPLFTGDPRSTTAPPDNDNDNSIPTTAWVRRNFVNFDPANPPVNGTDLSKYAPLASPVFTGDPRSNATLAPTDNDTSLATTAWVTGYVAANIGGGNQTPTPPVNPVTGQLWYDLTTGVLAIYVDDGQGTPSKQWVAINNLSASTV